MPSMVFDPTIVARVITTTLAVTTLVSVVAAGIAIGVVISRQSDATTTPFVQTKVVLRSDISVAINRLITGTELDELYDRSMTLDDLIISLNEQIKLFFPQTSIKIIISTFSGRPILVSTLRRIQKKELDNRPSIVTVNGSAYFTQNYTSNQIRTAFYNYTRPIVLNNLLRQPSTALGTFSTKYSFFTDTYPTDLTLDQVSALTSIFIVDTVNATQSPG